MAAPELLIRYFAQTLWRQRFKGTKEPKVDMNMLSSKGTHPFSKKKGCVCDTCSCCLRRQIQIIHLQAFTTVRTLPTQTAGLGKRDTIHFHSKVWGIKRYYTLPIKGLGKRDTIHFQSKVWGIKRYYMWRVGRGREPWERSEAGGVNDNERHLRHSPVSSPTEELRKE